MRQTDEPDKIDKKEAGIGQYIRESFESFKQGQEKLSSLFDAFGGVLARELEIYKLNLEEVCNAPDKLGCPLGIKKYYLSVIRKLKFCKSQLAF